MTKSARSKLALLEIGRGLAALLVVFHHAARIMGQERFFGTQPFGGWFEYFYVGVDFFFVLSGFIMAWIHLDDVGQPGKAAPFLWKRFLRIYPPYWVILLPLTAAYLLFASAGQESQREPLNILMSFLLLPYSQPPVLGVAWTLVHEVFFYLIFAAAILLGRRAFWILMGSWALAIIAASFAGPLPFPVSFVLSPFNIEFIIGICTAALVRRVRMPASGTLAVAGAALFATFIFLPPLHEVAMVGRLAFGMAAAIFIAGAAEFETHRTFRVPTVLTFLGAASYAVYLIHPIALSASVHIVHRLFGSVLPVEATVFILVAAGTLAGCLFHELVEKRVIRIVRQLRGRTLVNA